MTTPTPSNARKMDTKLLLIAAFVLCCATVGSLSYAIGDPARRENGRKTGSPAPITSKPASTATGGQSSSSVRTASAQSSSREPKASFRMSDLQQQGVEVLPTPEKRLDLVEFSDVSLSEAMRLFSEQSGMNVITSTDAGKVKVTVFLKNVTPISALEALVRANGLFYRIEPSSGIVRIATLKEYEKDLSSFREEQTKVFTLLYPNPSAVALVIKQVFGDRVQLNRADAEAEDLVDLSRRFNRFDLVDRRSLGLGRGSHSGSGGASGQQVGNQFGMGSNPFGMGGMNNTNNPFSNGMMNGNNSNNSIAQIRANSRQQNSLQDLAADQIQQLENEMAENGLLSEEVQNELMQRKEATIYVSTIRRNNQVIVRTGDSRSMEQIVALVAQLDVPTPTVLLEVKVLRVVLADGFNSAFEYFGGNSKSGSAFSDGSLTPSFPGASSVTQQLSSGLGVAGNLPGALTFQMVDKNFRMRMQLLESKNCVTALATPLILTANNEVSRIFVGDTLPFTIGFTPSQVLSSVGSVNGAVAATPMTELRDVGQSLLITPNINADRTVTLRVVEENSERVIGGSSIPVPATSGSGVTNINVDTVRRRTISGTVVAQDGMAVALGGMIEEHSGEARDQVPVLGNIPGLGFFFRRQTASRARSELVVIVRPYVFNTPSESAATSELLLGELSTHPEGAKIAESIHAKLSVTRSDEECKQRAQLFKFHTSVPVTP
ncbi:MAG: hypothetical protein U0930_15500 [Pirellulales bacterium]